MARNLRRARWLALGTPAADRVRLVAPAAQRASECRAEQRGRYSWRLCGQPPAEALDVRSGRRANRVLLCIDQQLGAVRLTQTSADDGLGGKPGWPGQRGS